jgi:glycine/D-amino acid oxidase-like deaminating enzyme
MRRDYDAIIVGGGFYGLRIAQFLREKLGVKRVLVLEKEAAPMRRASYNNQARVHNGYHYPRSILTALRSRVNLPVFAAEFKDSIVDDFDSYYAVARGLSKVTARQFEVFAERIEAEIARDEEADGLFNTALIERAFLVKEFAFNASKLRTEMERRLRELGVEIRTREAAAKVEAQSGALLVTTRKGRYAAGRVINATYSSLNRLNQSSRVAPIPLKHELTEMCLVRVPPALADRAVTVMCGPFFSLMPFPPKGVYTLSHVRFTPHREWHDSSEGSRPIPPLRSIPKSTNYAKMFADVKRYLPAAKDLVYTGRSLWEIKTVLPRSEEDDSRPIMYLENYEGIPGYICIMGAKIDNIYDVFTELKETYAKG